MKQALRYVEDCEKEAFKALGDFSLIQLYSLLSGVKLGAEGKRDVRELVDAYDSNELKEVVREAVDKICENAEKLEFSQEQVREIREYWGKDIHPPGA